MNRVNARYLESIRETVEQMKTRQALMLEGVVDEAMDAWERSKQPTKRVRRRSAAPSRSNSPNSESSVQVETQAEWKHGDVHFLEAARAALADLRKLYGLDVTRSTGI